MLNLNARVGVGLEFLRVGRPTAAKTLVGYAFESAVGAWIVSGNYEFGAEMAFSMGLNGNALVGDLFIDTYLSGETAVTLGVRRIWQ